jgi:hypothetical protein
MSTTGDSRRAGDGVRLLRSAECEVVEGIFSCYDFGFHAAIGVACVFAAIEPSHTDEPSSLTYERATAGAVAGLVEICRWRNLQLVKANQNRR